MLKIFQLDGFPFPQPNPIVNVISYVVGSASDFADQKDDSEDFKNVGVTDPKQLHITKEAPKEFAKPNKKIALVVGACHGVGYEAGLSLLRRFPQSSRQ